MKVAPFPAGYRASGVLLHVTSLPGPYPIGDFGPAACAWVDRLTASGQSYWQVLPLGPTGFGNSPFEPLSTFALNPLLVSPDWLIEDRLLSASDVEGKTFSTGHVDYEAAFSFKSALLDRAWNNRRSGGADLQSACDAFCQAEADWLDDYALFLAIKAQQGGGSFLEWPAELARRDAAALARARAELAEAIERHKFTQFLLFRQLDRLKRHARERRIALIGDTPFFVALDSSDFWANPELFLLDEHGRPSFVAGVPPDYFSPLGQLWGTPIYDWEAHRRSGYAWWIKRLKKLLSHVDLVRLDHFRAFAAAWHVPAGALTAQTGQWRPGPGAEFFHALTAALGGLPLIAEDLGLITDDVRALRDQFELPGMRVLQFAFDGDPKNLMLPENFVPNVIAYTGTHDNNTTRGWYESLSHAEQAAIWAYLKRPPGASDEIAAELIRQAWSSQAALAIAPLQDVLNLDATARMNVPGDPHGNWSWRATAEMFLSPAFERLRVWTDEAQRSPAAT
ncbi:MAG TPA: 4-alpha-glucanotransferase [Pirellulales bacterium]|nr:4-alpha-glucanotransferase [Pirellulales bacterium]